MNRKDWFTACSAVEKEALYRAELENYSEKLVVNGEGRIVFINEKYAAEFGKTPADIEGMTMAELFSRIKAPVILDIRDFDIPFIPHVDAVPGKSDGYIPIFIRSPLMDEKGAHVGDMIYDGQTWLRRYRGLYDKLNELVDEYQYLHAAKRSNTNARFVGSSTAVVQLKREILLAAKTNATLLIEGETGTGKEVVANEVFSASARSGKRFVTLNCAAIPQELIESELFGYEEGAFTGAKKGGRLGLLEISHQGTLFLDEVEGMSPALQVKLLRVLQEREIMRVGGTSIIPIDVRIVAATNESLERKVAEGTFRRDLYYRLSTLPIVIPPLSERGDDLFLILEQFQKELGGSFRLTPQVRGFLKSYSWPGNIRELRNVVEYFLYTGHDPITMEDLPPTVFHRAPQAPIRQLPETPQQPSSDVFRFVLEQLYQASEARQPIGRERLLQLARDAFVPTSQQEIRSILAQMADQGLVRVSRGRGGSQLTPEGRQLYETGRI